MTRSWPSKLGKYDVLDLLGEGSMGLVFLARDPTLERDVAIKVMAGAALRDTQMRERFEREAKSIARLHHPNIVTVHDLGYDEQGLPFIAMELLRGRTLEAAIEESTLSVANKLDVVAQICRGLSHAHENGIVHRDIKPANVFLAEDGTAKLMDFGVARWTQTSRTQAGLVVGTAGYMSPEQLRGKSVDGRSDLFSLGVVLYELLTHQLLFGGDTLEIIFFKTLSRDTPKLALPDGERVPELQDVLERALARDIEARFATAEEMERALAALVAGHDGRLAGTSPLLAVEASSAAGRVQRDSPRRRSSQPTVRLPSPGPGSRTAPARERAAGPTRPRSSAGARRQSRSNRFLQTAGLSVALLAIGLGGWALLAFGPRPLGLGAESPEPQEPPATVPATTLPIEPNLIPAEPRESLVADAALALAAGDLAEAEELVERGERLDPEDARWSALKEQLRARRVEADRLARAERHVDEAERLLAAGKTEGAIEAYRKALAYAPESADARSGLERAVAEREEAERAAARTAPVSLRSVVESRTEYRASRAGAGELLGFESEAGLRVGETAEPSFPAQVIIELDPADAQPGESYFLRVRVFNEGYRPLDVRDLSLVSAFDGRTSGKGQALAVRVSRVAPRATVLIYEAAGTWKEIYASGKIEAVVVLEDGGELRKSIQW